MARENMTERVALVTGATGGIGRATVTALAIEGAVVIATDIAGDASVEGAASYAQLDVTSEAGWQATIQSIEAKYGRLDILVNNAGISLTKSILDTSLSEVRACLATNVESVFLGTRAAQPLMARSGSDREGGSSIVNMSSIAGLGGVEWMSVYSAAKGAVRLFTKSAALEFAMLKLPIRVNSVHPGGVATDMMKDIHARYVEDGIFPDQATASQTMASGHPLGRLAMPAEIAGGIVYLASSAASFVTGSELVIDGGVTAR